MMAGDEVYGDDVTSGMFPDLLADPDFVRDEIRDHPPEATVESEYAADAELLNQVLVNVHEERLSRGEPELSLAQLADTSVDWRRVAVERPDLSKRTALSKSVLSSFEMCQTKTWFGIHDPRPFITNEKVVFGSAVDAGVEVIVKALSTGQKADLPRAFSAAAFIVEREDIELVFSQVEDAVESFLYDVVPQVDFTHAVTQANVTATIPGLGECNGHPDIIMDDGSVLDVKTSARAKVVPSLELGFYALLLEATGQEVPTVGYLNYVRLKKPYWHGYTKRAGDTMGQPLIVPVTDDLRSWAYARASAYVRARDFDPGENVTMTGGPRFDSMCLDCPYNPALGGPCDIAVKGTDDADAA